MEKVVSIIIPNYNYGNYLLPCLESIQKNKHQSLDVITVDDCSTENKISSVPLGRLIINKKNMGTASTINVGLRESAGDFVMIVSADDMITPGSISDRIKMFKENPELEVVYGAMQKVSADASYDQAVESLKVPLSHKSVYTVPMYRRSVFQKFGILCEGLRGKEDKEMQYRLGVHEKSYCKPRLKFCRCNFPVYFYRRHDKAQRKIRDKEIINELKLFMVFDKQCKNIEINGINEKTVEFLK